LPTPDPTEQVLVNLVRRALLAQYTPPRPESLEISRVDWHGVSAKAQYHRLEPLLYETIKKLNCQSQVPEQVLQALQFAYTRVNVTNLLVYRNVALLAESFDRAHIPLVFLKGIALAEPLYRDIGLRPMGDIDILVPEHCVSNAASLLVEQGYTPSLEFTSSFIELFEEGSFIPFKQSQIPIEIHWHLIYLRYYYERIPVSWFWQRTQQISLAGHSVSVLSPEALLVHLVMHYFFQHKSEGLLWSHDIALLVAHYRESFNWDQVFATARNWHLGHVLQTVIRETEQRWSIQLIPEAWLSEGQFESNFSGRLLSLAYTAKYVDAHRFLGVVSIPGTRAKLVHLWRILFPSRMYMQTRYQIKHVYWIPLFYVARLLKGGVVFLRSLLSMGTRIIGGLMFPPARGGKNG
jgi:hypothetical protein